MHAFGFFNFFSKPSKGKPITRKSHPTLEVLEDRCVPSGNTISGFVYDDVNNNGLKEAGEPAIANSTLQLQNELGVVIATTTSDVNGYYEFQNDQTVNTTPASLTKEVIFPQTQTNFDLQGLLDQFDPSQGDLQSVEITYEGAITSTIRVENTSPSSNSTITGKVGGTLKLTAPNATETLALQENAGSFSAGIYDGAIDFGGTSGSNFGTKEASGNKSVTLTGASMSAYKGTGKVNVHAQAEAASFATGGGNLVVDLNSSARAKITVKYVYLPSAALQPGKYVIVQNPQPAGYNDGKESANGVVLNTPPGADSIPVTLVNQDAPNNNFGELLFPAKISGHVFEDDNNNSYFEPGEKGIANATVILTGTNDVGAVNIPTTTDANGFYSFGNLRPGNYIVTETQPGGYLDGLERAGTLGGSILSNDQISGIALQVGQEGLNYNFGEIRPAKISGHVYYDANDNGVKDAGEAGIGGATVTLSGSDDTGSILVPATTDANGYYEVTNIRPGGYGLTETQPAGWKDGQDRAGSLGGLSSNDIVQGISIPAGAAGVDYDFGEVVPPRSDLAIVKTASAQSVLVGSLLSYTLTITNNGPATAVDVTVTDQLPPGITFVSASGDGWTVAQEGSILVAGRASLTNGQVSVINVTLQAPLVVGDLVNTTEVTSKTPDDNPNNNKSTVTTKVINNPGNPFTKNVTPLGGPLILSKADLFFGSGPNMNVAFVDATLRTLLGRPATLGEFELYSNQLASGLSRQQLVANLWQSEVNLGSQVDQMYQAYLDRHATAGEVAAGIQELRSGKTDRDFTVDLLTSDEYLQSHPGTHGLVAGFHTDILGKLPDVSSLLLSAQALDNSTLQSFAQSMLTSNAGRANQIDSAYHIVLRRPANPAEIGFWTTKMQQSNLTQNDLVQALLGTDDFFQLVYNAAK